ncbi:uncharacterized protein LOC131071027 [Cryptomeria japonica]|uniref:uncharacterized protein LOC131071027 n=1 Tax=Cryptomeria japonica TaxID=3369 RepID=UPI0025AB9174|nr:uncharacterized protein LOC131071027 [Cryptomeria japonica]
MTKEKVENIKLFKDGGILGGSSDGASKVIAIFWNLRRVSGVPVKKDRNLAFVRFDHLRDENITVKINFSFRFERMWLDHPNLERAIDKWWTIDVKGSMMYRMVKKLRYLKDNIKKWNKEFLGDLFVAKSKAQLELKEIKDKIQTSGYNEVSIKKENEVLVKYHKIIRREEEFWKQRSRSLWLKAGDKNTKFFHMTSMKHKVANRISKLRIGRIETRKDNEIGNEARNVFKSLLLADCGLDHLSQRALLETIPSIINDVQNKAMVAIPSEEEIKKAVFSFDGNKASDPDGFPLLFFQVFWNILKSDVVKGVEEFLGARIILKEFNATFMVLIPKCLGANSMDQFHLISL